MPVSHMSRASRHIFLESAACDRRSRLAEHVVPDRHQPALYPTEPHLKFALSLEGDESCFEWTSGSLVQLFGSDRLDEASGLP